MPAAARMFLAVLVFLVAVGCSVAPLSLRAVVPGPGPVRRVLPNGIPIIIEEHRASDVVAVQLWVRAGGRDEAPAELGLAHYLEHMLFKGTATRPPGFIERDVEGVGGRINAGTSWDYTFYHTVLPARQGPSAVRMLADVAVNAGLEAGLLEAEKLVVLEEMRLNDDNPRRYLVRQLFASVYDAHPYGRPVIGRPELISALSRDTLVSFYQRHYAPEAFALVVVGAIDPAEIFEVARATLGSLPRTGAARVPPPEAPAARRIRVDTVRPGGQAHLGLAWLAPRLDHQDTPALDLLVSILGRTRTSRLVASLREGLGLVSAIGSSLSSMEAGGLVTITAQLDPGQVTAAEAAILTEIRRVCDEGVTAAELARAITAAEVQHEFSAETAEGRAREYGHAETTWTLEAELAYVDRLRSVSASEVQAVARRYLDVERYARVALVPPP